MHAEAATRWSGGFLLSFASINARSSDVPLSQISSKGDPQDLTPLFRLHCQELSLESLLSASPRRQMDWIAEMPKIN